VCTKKIPCFSPPLESLGHTQSTTSDFCGSLDKKEESNYSKVSLLLLALFYFLAMTKNAGKTGPTFPGNNKN